jgi:hypothetical protein
MNDKCLSGFDMECTVDCKWYDGCPDRQQLVKAEPTFAQEMDKWGGELPKRCDVTGCIIFKKYLKSQGQFESGIDAAIGAVKEIYLGEHFISQLTITKIIKKTVETISALKK